MRVAVAGAVLLVTMAAGCGPKPPANDGFGAGAGTPSGDTALSRDTLMAPGITDSAQQVRDSTLRDSTYRPQ